MHPPESSVPRLSSLSPCVFFFYIFFFFICSLKLKKRNDAVLQYTSIDVCSHSFEDERARRRSSVKRVRRPNRPEAFWDKIYKTDVENLFPQKEKRFVYFNHQRWWCWTKMKKALSILKFLFLLSSRINFQRISCNYYTGRYFSRLGNSFVYLNRCRHRLNNLTRYYDTQPRWCHWIIYVNVMNGHNVDWNRPSCVRIFKSLRVGHSTIT